MDPVSRYCVAALKAPSNEDSSTPRSESPPWFENREFTDEAFTLGGKRCRWQIKIEKQGSVPEGRPFDSEETFSARLTFPVAEDQDTSIKVDLGKTLGTFGSAAQGSGSPDEQGFFPTVVPFVDPQGFKARLTFNWKAEEAPRGSTINEPGAWVDFEMNADGFKCTIKPSFRQIHAAITDNSKKAGRRDLLAAFKSKCRSASGSSREQIAPVAKTTRSTPRDTRSTAIVPPDGFVFPLLKTYAPLWTPSELPDFS